jgi:putative hydrolase of the HAD superfamily
VRDGDASRARALSLSGLRLARLLLRRPVLSGPDSGIDVVLFDLGGVLVDFGGVEAMKQLSGITDDDELWHRWLTCRWVREFERGGCTPEEFAAGVVADWELSIAPDAYLEQFAGWLGGPLPGAVELVDATNAVVVTGCLSNTNALHWDRHFLQWQVIHALEHRFLSFELGAVKPDREVFDRVAAQLDAPRERILFLDDNLVNVEGARQAGFRSDRTKGVDEARAVLVRDGVLAG